MDQMAMDDIFGTMTPLEACQVIRSAKPGTPFDVRHAAAFDTILREAESASRIADLAAKVREAQKRDYWDFGNHKQRELERELDELLKARAS